MVYLGGSRIIPEINIRYDSGGEPIQVNQSHRFAKHSGQTWERLNGLRRLKNQSSGQIPLRFSYEG